MLALIADDDRMIRLVLTRLLERMGVEVLAAEDGAGLLALLEVHDPLFLVIDIQMPVLNGIETLKVIRAGEGMGDLPVVCISANTDPESVRQMINLGVTDYLLKPFDIERAAIRLRAVLAAALARPQKARIATTKSLDVLVADGTPEIGAAIRLALGAEHDVVTVGSGVQALTVCRDATTMPDVLVIGDDLGLMASSALAASVRRLATERGVPRPRLFRLTADPAEVATPEFDGPLLRTNLNEGLRTVFGVAALAPEAVEEFLAGMIAGPDLSTAIQGVVEGRIGWTMVEGAEPEDTAVGWCTVQLTSTIPVAGVDLVIGGIGPELPALPDPAAGQQVDEPDRRGAIDQVLLTAGGAVRDLGRRWGLDLVLGALTEGGAPPATGRSLQFRGEDGGRLWLAIGVSQTGGDATGEEPPS